MSASAFIGESPPDGFFGDLPTPLPRVSRAYVLRPRGACDKIVLLMLMLSFYSGLL